MTDIELMDTCITMAHANVKETTSGSREEDAGTFNGFIDGFKAAVELNRVGNQELIKEAKRFTCDHVKEGRDYNFGCCHLTKLFKRLGH